MVFTSRRGRPKKLEVVNGDRPEKDSGTAELQSKRLMGLTAEPADIARDRKIITDEQYWAAIHFRWLYTVRFGAPGISALDLESYNTGRQIIMGDEAWQAAREREYGAAIEALRAAGLLKTVMNIAVFNHMPGFLKKPCKTNRIEAKKFRAGLDILAGLWGRTGGKSLKFSETREF